jgi:hypothetical protein
MEIIGRACAALSLVAALLAAAAPAQAQQASATVAGTVYDPSDAVVENAAVSLRNTETNQTLSAKTDRRGQYRIPYVPVGAYQLSIAAPGFATTFVELALTVGQSVDVSPKLTIADATETVTVDAPAPLVDAGRTHMAETVTPREIDTLPLNGRNYLDLALLAPNVSRTNTRSNERFAETSAVPGTGLSVAGQRNIGNTFVVDGLSANDDAADLAGTYYGEEVIREFQLITSGGTAEFGRASAGIVNIVTQSGTNRRRGRAYGFFRDDVFDARNPLATRKDPLSQSQFGVTFGGPVARDRTFWFANVERTDQDKTGIVTIAPASVTAINAALDAFRYAGPRASTGEFPTGYETANVFGKVDHQATRGDRYELRYSWYDVTSENARGVGGLSDVSRGTALENRDQTAAVSWLASPSAAILNEARAQYTRSRLAAPANDPIGPAITISGVANMAASTTSPTGRNLDVVQVADTLTLQRPGHLVKAGVDFLYNDVTIQFPGALTGTYTFTSLANLQRGQWQQFQQAFGDPAFTQHNPNLGLFLQDEWKALPSLSVNAGLRYDLQWLPSPIRLDANNVSPRLGVAWAPGDGQTVVRASGGVYYDRIPLRSTSNALQRDGVRYKVAVLAAGQAGGPVFPGALAAFPSTLVTAISTMDPDIQNGRSEQLGLQVERALWRIGSASVGYSRLRGRNIIMSRNVNVPTLTAAQAAALGIANLGRPNPEFANISRYESIGDSWFDGLTVSASTRPADWGTARVSYTFSKAMDTAGNAFFSTPQDNADIAAEKGPSDNDQRHRLMVSGTVGGGPSGAVARALAGIQFGYVFSYATGVPFNVLAGSDLNNDTNFNDRPRGVGRNSARQPDVSSLDLRISRAFLVGGRHRLEAMLEAFNVLNHVNVVNVNNTFFAGAAPSATFGQPTVAGDPRQIQLGVRWSF